MVSPATPLLHDACRNLTRRGTPCPSRTWRLCAGFRRWRSGGSNFCLGNVGSPQVSQRQSTAAEPDFPAITERVVLGCLLFCQVFVDMLRIISCVVAYLNVASSQFLTISG